MNPNTSFTKRKLGQTDIEVTPIGLGVMQFAGRHGFFRFFQSDISQEEMDAIIQAALEGGINWFDTAEIYGGGQSERGLSGALKTAGKTDDEVVIGTKWFPVFRRAGSISRTINERIRFLDGYSIDLYMVHNPWSFSSPEAEMDAMADLVGENKIRSVGVSNFNADQMRRAHETLQKRGLPLAVNQVQYSLLNREIETNGVLDTARELGVTIVAYTPLGSGLLTGKYHNNPELLTDIPRFRRMRLEGQIQRSRPIINALTEIAAKHQATPGQAALNWIINFKEDNIVTIPGASRVEQARENAGAMTFTLTQAEIDQLDDLSRAFR
jgi:aryl-alcohol dehydrogenase-like predicted oxidoreductase